MALDTADIDQLKKMRTAIDAILEKVSPEPPLLPTIDKALTAARKKEEEEEEEEEGGEGGASPRRPSFRKRSVSSGVRRGAIGSSAQMLLSIDQSIDRSSW